MSESVGVGGIYKFDVVCFRWGNEIFSWDCYSVDCAGDDECYFNKCMVSLFIDELFMNHVKSFISKNDLQQRKFSLEQLLNISIPDKDYKLSLKDHIQFFLLW